jgi:hypothetical protein
LNEDNEPEVDLEDLTQEQREDMEKKVKRYMAKLVPVEKRRAYQNKEKPVENEHEIPEVERELARKPMFDLSRKESFDKNENYLIGKYMLRDMPFFKFEMILYFAMLIVGVLVWYMDIREIFPGISRILLLVFVIVPVFLWYLKSNFFMPRKNRVPGARLYKSGIIELGIFDITKGYISFGHGENEKKKFITKINKHIEASTGRPFIVVSELEGENLNLLKTDQPDMRSDEFNALLEMNTMVTTKNVMARMLRFAQPKLSNPLVLLQIITLCLLAVVLAKEFGIFEMI